MDAEQKYIEQQMKECKTNSPLVIQYIREPSNMAAHNIGAIGLWIGGNDSDCAVLSQHSERPWFEQTLLQFVSRDDFVIIGEY